MTVGRPSRPRLIVLCEGDSERGFVDQVIAPRLGEFGIDLQAVRVTTGRKGAKVFRGGALNVSRLAKEAASFHRQSNAPIVTTLIDWHELPADFLDLVGGKANATVDNVERALKAHVEAGFERKDWFVPYIQMHEFEALFFADLTCVATGYPEHADALEELTRTTASMSPEDINHGADTHPAARLAATFGGKIPKGEVWGSMLQNIPFETLLARCPRFAAWYRKLESLGA